MIRLKNRNDIEKMRIAGRLTKSALNYVGEHIKPGVSTAHLDKLACDYIRKNNGEPSFLNYNGFPASVCISVNDEVIHGIPGSRIIAEGDIVSIDIGAYIGGYHGDCAKTYAVGNVSDEAKKLIDVTEKSFYAGLKFAKAGSRIGDISAAIQNYAEGHGCSVVVDFVGHGVGRDLHEDPSVPNYGRAGRGVRLVKGMTIAIEPMLNAGGYKVFTEPNGWTVRTSDGSLSSHYENTVLITDGEPEILTSAD